MLSLLLVAALVNTQPLLLLLGVHANGVRAHVLLTSRSLDLAARPCRANGLHQLVAVFVNVQTLLLLCGVDGSLRKQGRWRR